MLYNERWHMSTSAYAGAAKSGIHHECCSAESWSDFPGKRLLLLEIFDFTWKIAEKPLVGFLQPEWRRRRCRVGTIGARLRLRYTAWLCAYSWR
jgi:hypothetical protein